MHKLSIVGQAMMDFFTEYELARDNNHIQKPISYALYHTWEKWDKMEKAKKDEGKCNE